MQFLEFGAIASLLDKLSDGVFLFRDFFDLLVVVFCVVHVLIVLVAERSIDAVEGTEDFLMALLCLANTGGGFRISDHLFRTICHFLRALPTHKLS